jgi:hypothetical protein
VSRGRPTPDSILITSLGIDIKKDRLNLRDFDKVCIMIFATKQSIHEQKKKSICIIAFPNL